MVVVFVYYKELQECYECCEIEECGSELFICGYNRVCVGGEINVGGNECEGDGDYVYECEDGEEDCLSVVMQEVEEVKFYGEDECCGGENGGEDGVFIGMVFGFVSFVFGEECDVSWGGVDVCVLDGFVLFGFGVVFCELQFGFRVGVGVLDCEEVDCVVGEYCGEEDEGEECVVLWLWGGVEVKFFWGCVI